ncbi:MAG: CPXCG motif-containing cysteine-rich protein [Anaerolineae bacterium]
MDEHEFTCPYCWQAVTMLLDQSVRRQSYVEDCEICCNPIQIVYEYDHEGYLMRFEAQKLDQ